MAIQIRALPRLTPSAAKSVRDEVKAQPFATNPARNAAAFAALKPEVKEMLREAFSPANGGNPAEAPAVIAGTTPEVLAAMGWASWESAGTLIPYGGLQRTPTRRFKVLGCPRTTFLAGQQLTVKFRPQTRFKGLRMGIPSSVGPGSITNLVVGTRPIYVGGGSEPLSTFSELSTAADVDFPICELGQEISASITLDAAGDFYAGIFGQALDDEPYPELMTPLMRLPIPETNLAAGASTTITLFPQARFKLRKLVIDAATGGKFLITSFQVGIKNQFESGDPVPALLFSEKGEDIWLDGDVALAGNTITLGVTNLDTVNPQAIQGVIQGDVDES